MPLVLIVEMRLHPGKSEAFMPLLLENARHSLADEPGCRRFDVLRPVEGADRVVLYEIYDSEDAFDAHRTTDHYIEFKAAARDLLAETIVQRFSLVV
jgi:autoinducer 2-degrading protein